MAKIENTAGVPAAFRWVAAHRHLLVPLSFLALLIVLVIPLPPAVMDLLISANISLAAVILVTTIYMLRPLDFSVFPALLLGTTLFRLVLNIASTRLILSADADSPDQATAVAGQVIEAFGHFVAGESVIVGAIIFIILVVVQFVVITKGATRMSEVAARFTLDAMPGKQMAIDADLAAGLIDEAEARQRRDDIMREADFYGAMDGASKFVRGDAIAGIIITLVNIIGGFAIGALEKGWTMSESISVFTTLTIGDGLVSQVPSFIIAIAAGLIVARTSDRETIGDEIPRQLASQPTALYMISGFLGVLSFTPLPTVPLLAAGAMLGGIAFSISQMGRQQKRVREAEARAEAAAAPAEQGPVEELLHVDALEIEIGYGLVALVVQQLRGQAPRGGDRGRHRLPEPPDGHGQRPGHRPAGGRGRPGARLRPGGHLDRSGPEAAGRDHELHGRRRRERGGDAPHGAGPEARPRDLEPRRGQPPPGAAQEQDTEARGGGRARDHQAG
jgi:flagellar biosynthesis protein FlhA